MKSSPGNFRGLTRKSSQSGFTLIEVLVSLLVLLIGLLGVVGMQLLSVQNNQGAYLRTQATYIASDFLDRVRVNKAGQDIDSYSDPNSPFDTAASIPSDSAGTCATSAGGCTPAQLANLDLRELTSNFANVYSASNFQPVLPGGRAQVNKVVGAETVEYTVTVFWDERDWQASGPDTVRGDGVERFVELRTLIRDK